LGIRDKLEGRERIIEVPVYQFIANRRRRRRNGYTYPDFSAIPRYVGGLRTAGEW
jgi:hypothetical protein